MGEWASPSCWGNTPVEVWRLHPTWSSSKWKQSRVWLHPHPKAPQRHSTFPGYGEQRCCKFSCSFKKIQEKVVHRGGRAVYIQTQALSSHLGRQVLRKALSSATEEVPAEAQSHRSRETWSWNWASDRSRANLQCPHWPLWPGQFTDVRLSDRFCIWITDICLLLCKISPLHTLYVCLQYCFVMSTTPCSSRDSPAEGALLYTVYSYMSNTMQ